MTAKNTLHGQGNTSYLTTFEGQEISCLDDFGKMTSQFREWLNLQEPFRYEPNHGTDKPISVRPELRKGKPYWYGYLRREGKLEKEYIGSSDELTPEKLETAAIHLNYPLTAPRREPKPVKPKLDRSTLEAIASELLADPGLTRNGKDRGSLRRGINVFITRLCDDFLN
ncbi:hypothetical protein HC928_22140 [bacterium]|nr:hypothetical protein [bacterium]